MSLKEIFIQFPRGKMLYASGYKKSHMINLKMSEKKLLFLQIAENN